MLWGSRADCPFPGDRRQGLETVRTDFNIRETIHAREFRRKLEIPISTVWEGVKLKLSLPDREGQDPAGEHIMHICRSIITCRST